MESFWQELEGVYICNNCKSYSNTAEDKCSGCESKMVGIQERIKFSIFLEKDLTNKE